MTVDNLVTDDADVDTPPHGLGAPVHRADQHSDTRPLSNNLGTRKTVKATFWPWLSGKCPYNPSRCPLFARRCFHWGAQTMGGDIDIRVIRGKVCSPNMAHIRQSRPDSGLGFRDMSFLANFDVVPSSLGSGFTGVPRPWGGISTSASSVTRLSTVNKFSRLL